MNRTSIEVHMRIMKIIILMVALVIMLTMAIQARSQVNLNARIIDSVIVKARTIGLNAASVNWDSVRKRMQDKAFDAKSVYDLQKSFEFMLTALNDRHGTFFDPSTKTSIARHSGAKTSEELKVPTEFYFTILEHDVRYLRIAGIPSGDSEAAMQEVQKIRLAVDSLLKGDPRYWILDLRYASGGDMKPLFAGLAPILDEGLIATTVDNRGKINDMFTVHNGNFYVNQVRVGKFPPHATDLKNAKVAVLTSRYTSGAPEILSIALKGRKHTQFFGEATAGNIFGMAKLEISKNLAMELSQYMYVNRKGIEYKHELTPDVMIEFTNSDLKHDEAVKEASSWLRKEHAPETVAKVAAN